MGYATHVIAHCAVDEDVVSQVLEGMVEDNEDLVSIVRVMTDTTLEAMATDTHVPMHAGAVYLFGAVWPDDDAIVDAACEVPQQVNSDTGRLKILCSMDWAEEVSN